LFASAKAQDALSTRLDPLTSLARDVQNSDSKLMHRINIHALTDTQPSAWRAAIKWRRGTILAWMLIGLFAGALALLAEQRRHVVTGEVLLPSFASTAKNVDSDARESFVAAQIETIKSDHIIAATLDKLAFWDEADSPAFSGSPILTSTAAGSSEQRAQSASATDAKNLKIIGKIKDLLSVSPVASDSAVRVTLTSRDPNKAALLVNAVLDAYVEDYEKNVRDAPKQAVQELQQRLDTLQERAATAEGQAQAGASSPPERQKLEAVASTYRSLHQQTLSEYANALNAEPPPSSGPRVLTRASSARTSPAISTAVLGAALLGGGLIGFAFATRKEQVTRPVRTLERLESDTGLPVLGVVSVVQGRKLYPKNGAEPPLLLHDDKDGLRGVLLRLRENFNKGTCVVGVASTFDGEGKSTLAFNLAVLGVEGGARVLLLDGNLHRPALARGLTGTSSTELLSALKDPSDLVSNVVKTEFGFDFLGEQSISDDIRPAVLLASPDRRRAGSRNIARCLRIGCRVGTYVHFFTHPRA
jgi:Mrp family chromosome partitioning ATPase